MTKLIEIQDPNVGLVKSSFGASSSTSQAAKNATNTKAPKEKLTLNQVSGQAHPGQVLAIMGPSGSGKTSLLDVLACRASHQYGNLILNGHIVTDNSSATKALKRKLAYIRQDDLFFTHLTVRDQLTYTAFLRMGQNYTHDQTVAQVQAIIKTLRLTKCAETPIRLISGGERKRVNIGTELLTDPSILVLDEPTSGLDSTSAVALMALLRQLARDENLTVITSIHQPSSAVFMQFDSVLFLADGCAVYHGSPLQSLEYCKGLDMACPDGYNAADHWMDLLVEDSVDDDIEEEEATIECLDTSRHPISLLEEGKNNKKGNGHLSGHSLDTTSFPISLQGTQKEAGLDQTSFPVSLVGKVRSKELSLDRTTFPVQLGGDVLGGGDGLDRTSLPVTLAGNEGSLETNKRDDLDRLSPPSSPLEQATVRNEESDHNISNNELSEMGDDSIHLPKMKTPFARFSLIARPSNYSSVTQKPSHLLDKTQLYREQYNSLETSKAKLIRNWDVDAFAQEVEETDCDVSDELSISGSSTGNDKTNPLFMGQKYKTSWMTQFKVLLHRSMKNSRSALLTPLNFIKAILLGFFTGALWFQLPNDEMHMRDRGSFLFFSITFWVFDSTFSAIFGFPQERDILFKERASGSYHLSAYFLSKIMSDFPTRLVLPATFWTISYWMAGINPSFWVFLGTMSYLLLSVFAGESYGLLVSAYVLDFEKSMTFMIVFSLTSMAAGGYYVQNIPAWIEWAKYISPFKFGYESAQMLVFNRPVPCDGTGDLALFCTDGVNEATPDEVLETLGSEGSQGVSIAILFCIIVIPRYFAYLALKSKRGAERGS